MSRGETQQRTRARVLSAARSEFVEHGFRSARIDSIADRAEMTRGAVYSNFPGKLALYFSVLAADAAAEPLPLPPAVVSGLDDALGRIARGHLARLPLAVDERRSPDFLGGDLLPEVADDNGARAAMSQLVGLQAIVLGIAFESLHGRRVTRQRMVRVAEALLTVFAGARQLAHSAPGAVDAIRLAEVCGRLEMDPDDRWDPPHLPFVEPAERVDDEWVTPVGLDLLRRSVARPGTDGLVAVLGTARLAAIEEALRSTGALEPVLLVVVSSEPAELIPLVELQIAELARYLADGVPARYWPPMRIVTDRTGQLAASCGIVEVNERTEAAVRIQDRRIVARAAGPGACHAAAIAR
ncbi:TetR/AcrR family transcriptional regulator [Nakamurella alba]|nr:TetR/AcrR family transcriptional regulator [Nakamurella alba]